MGSISFTVDKPTRNSVTVRCTKGTGWVGNSSELPTTPSTSVPVWSPSLNASGHFLTSNGTRNKYSYKFDYSQTEWTWTVTVGGRTRTARGENAVVTVDGLNPGTQYSVTASLSAKVYIVQVSQPQTNTATREPIKGGVGGTEIIGYTSWEYSGWSDRGSSSQRNHSTQTLHTTSGGGSKTIYTKPNSFYWRGVSRGAIIEEGLTWSDWLDFLRAADQYINWKNQSSGSNLAGSAVIPQGRIITASIYNNAARAIGISRRVEGGPNGTIITASCFTDLSAPINSG